MIIVTGGAGFIGSVLVNEFTKNPSNEVLVVDKFTKPNKWRNIARSNFVEFEDRDFFINNLDKIDHTKVQIVLHMGACADTTEFDMDHLMSVNYEYSKVLCNWCVKNEIRFIYASSASVYGDGAKGFDDDDAKTMELEPLNPYGFSKLLFDKWVIRNHLVNKVVGLRFFNVFGPNEYHKNQMSSVIYKCFPMAKKEGVVKLFKSHIKDVENGGQKRDFVYIKDVVSVIDFILKNKNIAGIFNLGTGKARSFNDLATATLTALDKKPIIEYFDMPCEIRNKYQYFTESNNSKLIASGYKKGFIELEDAVSDYIKNYLLNDDPYYR
jgi:ADP-L-glycero-D-manno-heptose 6-epimerase